MTDAIGKKNSCKQRVDNWASICVVPACFVLVGIAGAFCICTAWTEGESARLQVMICIIGAAMGWIFGSLITPSNAGEKQKFSGYSKAILTLLSGFGLAKIGEIAEWLGVDHTSFTSEVTMLRISLFISMFLVATLSTYISRSLGGEEEKRRRSSREKCLEDLEKTVAKLKELN